ncbi:uncharacterized protein LOC107424234 [Ziziphus jujuba]|uniref:Uncharacterized protein LOC107424234 n=2 Tax=Ziziphus jujuba TaxID=326968 RepID=A0A6P4A5W9_ZIZJJ|nr:uncharacterized protein LOC107424234 [Ziziphus jujuba]KAH7519690.1 hypothetical protein FEM48_Zijuj08G0063900 [Ziziphus jujuba var. spinosa]
MGMLMSLMGSGGGLPSSQMMNFVFERVSKQFMETKINNFEEFHVATLDIFSAINSALPGKHYDVPSRDEVKAVFDVWKQAKEERKKEIFQGFIMEKVNLSKVDKTTVMTGILTPPVAMAAKKAGEKVPQLKMIKAVPDVLFVPSATVLSLMSVKISRRIFMRNIRS